MPVALKTRSVFDGFDCTTLSLMLTSSTIACPFTVNVPLLAKLKFDPDQDQPALVPPDKRKSPEFPRLPGHVRKRFD